MKSEELKMEKKDIVERSVVYALRVIRLSRELENDHAGRVLGKQLLRSGTSIGANVHEAQGAQSKADFISKMSIAHKEARESAYWLRLIGNTQIVSTSEVASVLDETQQLIKILSSILLTSKANSAKREAILHS